MQVAVLQHQLGFPHSTKAREGQRPTPVGRSVLGDFDLHLRQDVCAADKAVILLWDSVERVFDVLDTG